MDDRTVRGLNGAIDRPDDFPDDFSDGFPDEDFDPERLVSCEYWRCGELFEARSANHRFCRKACRSRQRKWERAQERRAVRAAKRQSAARPRT